MTTLEKLMIKMTAAGGNIAKYEATGNPLTFETNVAKNLKSLLIPWTPTQSGSGDPSPSNVRPISGITGLNVYHPGNNIVPPDAEYEENYFINSSGEVESNNSYKYTPDYIPVEPNTTYYVSMNKTISTALGFTVPLYDSSKGFIERIVAIGSSGSSGKGTYTGSFTTTSATAFIRISVPKNSDTIEVRNQKNYAVVFPALGKNLFDKTDIKENKSIDASGEIINVNGYVISDLIPINGQCVFTATQLSVTGGKLRLATYNSSGTFIERFVANSVGVGSKENITVNNSNVAYVRICMNPTTESIDDAMVELGTTATTYEPYTNTVYGGSLDLTTGVLTVEWAIFDLSQQDWSITQATNYKLRYCTIGEMKANDTLLFCNQYAYGNLDINDLSIQKYTVRDNARIKIRDDSKQELTKAEWEAAIEGVYIASTLATPVTYQLTPTDIQTLIGDNVIWSDTNGSNTATYLKKG